MFNFNLAECKHCGEEYEIEESDALEPTKFCSAEHEGNALEEEEDYYEKMEEMDDLD